MTARQRSFGFYAVLLAALSLMMPLGTDIFLPSMPAFAREYGVGMGTAELTLSAFFAGSATGQLIWGPLSDRYGRKPLILVAIATYFIAAGAVALSDSFAPVVFWRFVQGMSASAGRILANAVSRDLFDRERLAQLIASIMTFGALATIVTGPIGGVLAEHFEWQAVFIYTGAYAAILFVLCAGLLDETVVEKNPLALRPIPMVMTMAGIARDRTFISYVLLGACGMAGMSGFINSSPGLLIGRYGVEPSTYGAMFAVMPVGFMAGSFLFARYGRRLGGERFMLLGAGFVALAGAAYLGLAVFGVPHPLLLMAPMMPYLFGFSLMIPYATSGALSPFGRVAGTASSLQGFIQSMSGALISAVLGLVNNGTLYPMAIAIGVCGVGTLGVYFSLVRPLRRAVAPPFPPP